MKAILIARVSTEEQKEAGNSLPAQIARLEKYCISKGFKIWKTYSFDESAYKTQRNEFDAILDMINAQKEKIVVCCDKVDRLTRNIFDKRVSLLYEKALNDQAELHFVSEGQVINSSISAATKFQFSISLGLAKYYSDAISDNVKRANEQKLRKGEWIAKAPYGYEYITLPDGRKDIIITEHEAYLVKQAFEFYATGAFSMSLLLQRLKNDFGIDWHKSFLDKMFLNPFYYGVMEIKGKQYPHRYPPIITKSLYDQVQKIKSNFNKRKKFKYAGLPYIYRGLLRCGDCGLAITPEKHKGFVYYHCTQYNGKHGATWFREEKITEILGSIFKQLQMPEDIARQISDTLAEDHTNKANFTEKKRSELTHEHKKVTLMLDNLYMDKLKGSITDSEYDKFYTRLRDQLIEVETHLGQLEDADENYYRTAKCLLKLISKAHELFLSSEVEERRLLIKLVLSNLRIEGENVLHEANKPFDLFINNQDSVLWRP